MPFGGFRKSSCIISFLAYDVGEDFLRTFHLAADGKLAPFILVIEGSISNEQNKKEGCWASFGTNQTTGQPIATREWIDRLAPKAWAVSVGRQRCQFLTSGILRWTYGNAEREPSSNCKSSEQTQST